MSEEKKPFTVTDRRHFTREGEVREDVPAPPPEPKAATRPSPPPEPPAQPARVITDPGRAPDPAHARAEASYRQVAGPESAQPDEAGGLDFVGLLLSLGTQASMMLGLGGRPGAPPGPPDLAGAPGRPERPIIIEAWVPRERSNPTKSSPPASSGSAPRAPAT